MEAKVPLVLVLTTLDLPTQIFPEIPACLLPSRPLEKISTSKRTFNSKKQTVDDSNRNLICRTIQKLTSAKTALNPLLPKLTA